MKNCIIVDLDGTLAINDHRDPHDHEKCGDDKLNEAVYLVILAFICLSCYKIIIITGRDEKYRELTEKWFKKHSVRYHDLFMRPTGDKRPDTEVKKEIYEREIKGKYNVLFVLEDRSRVVKMYRDLGLQVWQVAEGNY